MENKTRIIIALIIISLIGLAIGNKIYNDNDYLSLVLVCDYNTEYTNYEEKLEFNFVDKTLYEYRREETMSATEKTKIKDIKELFKKQYDSVKDNFSDYFNYEVVEHDSYVEAKTYIKTLFNEEKGITMSSSIDEVEKSLSEDYTCHREKRG